MKKLRSLLMRAMKLLETGVVAHSQACAEETIQPDGAGPKRLKNSFIDKLVRGGQFKDLILPMPIIKALESEGIWGNSNVIPRDIHNGMDDPRWHFWGGNPVKGKDGRYHVAICRWPAEEGFGAWRRSHAAHYVSDHPIGPYTFTQIIVHEMHNPEVLLLPDGRWALNGMRAGIYTAERMPGPWMCIGNIELDTRGFRKDRHMGANVSKTLRPDGSILALRKNGDVTVSRKDILGPYRMLSIQNYDRATGYPEDPVIWRSQHQYHVVFNHNLDYRSAYMRSLDGVHWKNEYGLAYAVNSDYYYTDGSKNKWHCLERPKVIQDEWGRATHITFGATDVLRDLSNGPQHGSKNLIMPLVTEKRIYIEGEKTVDDTTRTLNLRIESEEGFDAVKDTNMSSLRFGSDSVVNYGGGARATASKADGKNLVVTFEGDFGLTHHDYDFKLLGRTTSDALIIGYSLLPGESPEAPVLIALPHRGQRREEGTVLECRIENAGLSDSEPQQVRLYRYRKTGRELIAKLSIPSIKPYASHPVCHTLDSHLAAEESYAFVIPGTPHEYWQRVDISAPSVTVSKGWKNNQKPDGLCFMGSELISDDYGNTITYTFEGTRAIAYGRTGRSETGSIEVTLDGERLETVTCRYGDASHEKVYQTPLLKHGVHTLMLKHVEAAQRNGFIAIDSFAFESLANAKE